MALTKGVNSYVSVAEADFYFTDRMDVAAWTAADETEKGKALVTATGLLDQLRWTGSVMDEGQLLAFPRNGNYFDPRVGTYVYLDSSTVPKRILNGTMELAYHLLNNDGLLDDSGSVKTLSVGAIVLNDIRTPETIPAQVRNIIKPLLVNGGGSTWWRAN